jgi:hypothetical protein
LIPGTRESETRGVLTPQLDEKPDVLKGHEFTRAAKAAE